jgi:SAM-dependent methyltransferase
MSSENKVACPSCCADNVRRLGPIPGSNTFAGRHLDRVLPGGALWRCPACHLLFRYPRLAKHELDALYRLGHDESWPDPVANRTDWVLASKLIAAYPGVKRVLDVGCFDGKLLDYLDSRYEKLGVEIHQVAAERAGERGIRIIAHDFAELASHPAVADAVLAVDVIEHTYNPLAFLAQLAQAASPGGLVIITTGNTDSPSWRLMGSRYWYCHIAEHISFINPAWAHWAAHRLGLEVVAIQSFSHVDSHRKWGRRLRELFVNLAYRASPWMFGWLRWFGAGGIDVKRFPELMQVPPYWLTAQDHLLIAFKKNVVQAV